VLRPFFFLFSWQRMAITSDRMDDEVDLYCYWCMVCDEEPCVCTENSPSRVREPLFAAAFAAANASDVSGPPADAAVVAANIGDVGDDMVGEIDASLSRIFMRSGGNHTSAAPPPTHDDHGVHSVASASPLAPPPLPPPLQGSRFVPDPVMIKRST
jgi:hypothetical protein